LAKGSEALLFCGNKPEAKVAPLPLAPETHNYWGVKAGSGKATSTKVRKAASAKAMEALKLPALSKGKPCKSSSNFSGQYDASKAFDGDMGTRWGAKGGSRSGWLEVDLGASTEIGRVVVIEDEFPRTQQFAVEYKDGDEWKVLTRGTKLGVKVLDFEPVKARYVRLNILKAINIPTLEEFRVCAPARP